MINRNWKGHIRKLKNCARNDMRIKGVNAGMTAYRGDWITEKCFSIKNNK